MDKYSLATDNPIETISGYFTCADNTVGFICSNQLKKKDDGTYLNDNLFESFCKYDRSKCYSSFSAEYAEEQSNEGKLVSVEEHMPMQAGTTANFGSGDVCSWHLQADTQYSPFRKMQVNFTISEGS